MSEWDSPESSDGERRVAAFPSDSDEGKPIRRPGRKLRRAQDRGDGDPTAMPSKRPRGRIRHVKLAPRLYGRSENVVRSVFVRAQMEFDESKNDEIAVAKWQMANGKRNYVKIMSFYNFILVMFAICHLPKGDKGANAATTSCTVACCGPT